jgi:hypothetical protein
MKLTNGNLSRNGFVTPAGNTGNAGGAASTSQNWGQSQSAASVQGTGSMTGLHNTPLHVGLLVLFAGAGLYGLRKAGFRFSFDAGFGK